MSLRDLILASEKMLVSVLRRPSLLEQVPVGRARMVVTHRRPTDFICNEAGLFVPDPLSYKMVDEPEEVWNLITNVGRDFLHVQSYGTSGIGANGLNFIALSNDTVTETAASTALSNEISANGFSRAQGAVTHTVGTNTSAIDRTFTATGSQAAQKSALFTAGAAGTMNHVLGFTQRALIIGDTLQITFTITIG